MIAYTDIRDYESSDDDIDEDGDGRDDDIMHHNLIFGAHDDGSENSQTRGA